MPHLFCLIMPMDYDADLLAMLNTSEHGSDATIIIAGGPSVAVQGIYVADYFEVQTGTSMGVESTQPGFICRSSDVQGVRHGDTLTIGADTFTIVGIKPDATGKVELVLETP